MSLIIFRIQVEFEKKINHRTFFIRLILECSGVFNLCTDIDKERLGRQAIRAIHEQMDDDKDGMIGPAESTDVSLSFEFY